MSIGSHGSRDSQSGLRRLDSDLVIESLRRTTFVFTLKKKLIFADVSTDLDLQIALIAHHGISKCHDSPRRDISKCSGGFFTIDYPSPTQNCFTGFLSIEDANEQSLISLHQCAASHRKKSWSRPHLS